VSARLVALVAVLAAGCSSTAWDEMRANPREYFNLNAPTLTTDARIDGTRVTLKRGQALVVRLDEEPETGQRWEMKPLPNDAIIAPVQHDLVTKSQGGSVPGAPADAIFRVRAVRPGEQAVLLEYRRPFESAVAKTVRFDVVVP
jgi:predicted secreted protein